LDIAGYDPPVTTWAGPDELVTLLDGCSADGAEEVVVEELVAPALEVEVPGIVSALTTARPPTPANAPTATPAVIRLSLRRAASRAVARVWIVGSLSMVGKPGCGL
jgi:hypothetical protein